MTDFIDYPPLPDLTRGERRLHDIELLAHLAAHGRPAKLTTLFRGFRPRWAVDAADRLLVNGLVRELLGERLELTSAGRDMAKGAA